MILIATIFFITGFVLGRLFKRKPRTDFTEIFFPDPKKRIELPTVYKAIKKLKPQNQLN
jgi:hypothetical protein